MKKIIVLASILTLVVVLICSCTQSTNEEIHESYNTKPQKEDLEDTDKNYPIENKNSVNFKDNHFKNNTVIDIATAENKTDYSCEVEMKEGHNGYLITTIVVKDADAEEMQRLTYETEFDKKWYDMYVKNGGEICRFLDFNLDGYPDVVTQLYGAMVNQWYKVWLYNPGTKQFENSEEYGALINPKINIDRKFVLSTRYEKGIPSYELFYVEDGHLAYQGSIIGEIGNDGKVRYIQRMYGYINEDGDIAYREIQSYEEINSVDDLDELWSAFEIELML